MLSVRSCATALAQLPPHGPDLPVEQEAAPYASGSVRFRRMGAESSHSAFGQHRTLGPRFLGPHDSLVAAPRRTDPSARTARNAGVRQPADLGPVRDLERAPELPRLSSSLAPRVKPFQHRTSRLMAAQNKSMGRAT